MKAIKHTLGVALGAALALAAEPGQAQMAGVQILVTLPQLVVTCGADDAAWAIANPATFAWLCDGAAARFRCTLTAPSQFNVTTKVLTATCNRLTELPPGNVNGLILSSGLESPQP